MENESKNSIKNTKSSFEKSFELENFYKKQTQDQEHLSLILNSLNINGNMKILDLGTGTGYLAFPIAINNPGAEVIGLDIVEKALYRNNKKAELEGIHNLKFINYDGVTFPFEDESFDMVITRYALHHFPQINDTFKEISRVLKPNGVLFISDPTPNEDDIERFVDAYMQMKKDGHIKFYTKMEWQTLGEKVGLYLIDSFETNIRFPKKKETALEFDKIIDKFNDKVIKGYSVEVILDEIWITEKVNNLLFRKGLFNSNR